MKTAKILTIFSLISVAIFSLSSCGGDPVVEPVVEYGKISLFHGAPGGSAVDLYLDGTKSTTASLTYGQGSAYVQATAGTITHKIVTKNTSGSLIDSVNLKLNKDVGYSYFIYKDNDATGSIRTIATTDVLTSPAAGKAKIRFVHLVGDVANNAGIDIEAAKQDSVATDRADFLNVKFKESKDYIEKDKGTYDIKVKYYGTKNLLSMPKESVTTASAA